MDVNYSGHSRDIRMHNFSVFPTKDSFLFRLDYHRDPNVWNLYERILYGNFLLTTKIVLFECPNATPLYWPVLTHADGNTYEQPSCFRSNVRDDTIHRWWQPAAQNSRGPRPLVPLASPARIRAISAAICGNLPQSLTLRLSFKYWLHSVI